MKSKKLTTKLYGQIAALAKVIEGKPVIITIDYSRHGLSDKEVSRLIRMGEGSIKKSSKAKEIYDQNDEGKNG